MSFGKRKYICCRSWRYLIWNCKKYNTSVQRLRELNNLNTDVLQLGDVLTVPTEGEESPKECVIYTVKKVTVYTVLRKIQFNSRSNKTI